PSAGVVRSLLAKEGESVPVGADIAIIEIDDGETATPETPAGDARPEAYSPVVRQLARENDLDLSLLTGTGEGGRITRKDVLSAIEAKRETGARSVPSEASPGV